MTIFLYQRALWSNFGHWKGLDLLLVQACDMCHKSGKCGMVMFSTMHLV